jgi:circadian clock protein KaiC
VSALFGGFVQRLAVPPLRMSKLVSMGVAGLDEVLLGGVTRNNNILVEGPPGAGKTTLGLRFIHVGTHELNEPGIIISFELDSAKLLRDAAGFDWDLTKSIEEGRLRILEAHPEALLADFRNSGSVLESEVRALGARRLLIDGLTPLKLYADAHDIPFRESIHLLIEGLTRLGVTTLMTREDDMATDAPHERYVFDTIISLRHSSSYRKSAREIQVVKSRGQDFIGGRHTMRIAPKVGIEVYRRAQSRPKQIIEQPSTRARVSSGCPALDEVMGGGILEGSVTLVTGISGTGKTVAGMQFLMAGVAAGKRGLLVSLDEHPEQILRNAEGLGFTPRAALAAGMLFLHYESPLELELDVHFAQLERLVEEHSIDFIVCDSIAVYEITNADETSEFLYALATLFKNRMCTTYFNYESPELMGVSQISEHLKGSHLVDNIILLSYVEISTRLRRAVAVPKARGSRNLQVTREFVIGNGGIRLIEEPPQSDPNSVPQLPFSAYYGLLSRSPSRRAPAVDQSVMNGEDLPATPKQVQE